MHMTIDEDSGIPIWLQLRNRLIYLITSGAFAPGDKLPTMRQLAVDLGINSHTVSRVYQDIERDGYIISQRGRGTFAHDGYLQQEQAAGSAAESLADSFILQCRELGVPREDIAKLVESRLRAAER